MYNDPTISFQLKNFLEFTNVIANTSCRISQNWVNKLNDGIKHLVFRIIGKSHMVHYVDFVVNMHFGFIRNDFDQVIRTIKIQCTDACDVLVKRVRMKVFRSWINESSWDYLPIILVVTRLWVLYLQSIWHWLNDIIVHPNKLVLMANGFLSHFQRSLWIYKVFFSSWPWWIRPLRPW
jgi:hypothetical protein